MPLDLAQYKARHIVEDLRLLAEHLGYEKFVMVAHDWGGAIGLGAATQMPERFSRFVLFNTAAFRSNRCPWRIRGPGHVDELEMRSGRPSLRRRQRRSGLRPSHAEPE